jgi:hypothetical protein
MAAGDNSRRALMTGATAEAAADAALISLMPYSLMTDASQRPSPRGAFFVALVLPQKFQERI